MDCKKLAELLFPDIDKTPADYELIYPARELPEGAEVTRLAPSPTGYIHLGNLYGALADERLAHRKNGICYLRIEDTDEKREVEGATSVLLDTLSYFGINFDEGVCKLGTEGSTRGITDSSAAQRGDYGPYWQSERSDIYKACVKYLVEQGKAYPCFMSEEEIEELRKYQEASKINPGVWGVYAKHRNLTYEEVKAYIDAGKKPVIRLKSEGDPTKYFCAKDAIRGEISMPENVLDAVILKKNDLPTYHFAHVVDDHLMRTTIVVRGEEWMPSLPIHVELFKAMGWKLPLYCHNTVLMKIDESTGQKRKLSKRKDPELALSFYKELGYSPEAVREYLMTILNSDYEEWRTENPSADFREFDFRADKMSDSGTLFDIKKLNDISKDVFARKSSAEIYDFMLGWADEYEKEKAVLFRNNKDMLLKIFDIDRGGKQPRKDFVYARQVFSFIKYFFDDYFEYEAEWPEELCPEDRRIALKKYILSYDPADDNTEWFSKVREIAGVLGYAKKPGDFRKNPELYKGHVGHVSGVIRIAITGRANSPDLWTIQQIMGKETVETRIKKAIER